MANHKVLDLRILAKVLQGHFQYPFVSEELVKVRLSKRGGTLNLKIGVRDTDLNSRGQVTGTGTSL